MQGMEQGTGSASSVEQMRTITVRLPAELIVALDRWNLDRVGSAYGRSAAIGAAVERLIASEGTVACGAPRQATRA